MPADSELISCLECAGGTNTGSNYICRPTNLEMKKKTDVVCCVEGVNTDRSYCQKSKENQCTSSQPISMYATCP